MVRPGSVSGLRVGFREADGVISGVAPWGKGREAMADELSAPLARRSDRKAARRQQGLPHSRRPWPIARLAFGVVSLILIGVALRVVLVEDPNGGRPWAEVPINSTHNANSVAGEVAPASVSGPATISADPETAVPVAGGPSFTALDDDLPEGEGADAPGVPDASGVIAGLAEATDDGPVPRIGADGTTPFAAYSRPTPAAPGKPMVAIVVSGMGLNEAGTLDAIAKLPDDVTLAFAPYGRTLPRTVAAAHAEGRETLLEVPLEPFDYPENDPGPETLLTGQPPRANMDKLFWLMARFGGYMGVINHMGARFTASGGDFGPVMEELGTRGLGYLDDGSSNRSLAAQLAATNKIPYSKADMQIDDNPARAPILAALAELERRALADGSAIGMASALPVSVDTIAEWAAGLGERGLALVPVSALMKGAP